MLTAPRWFRPVYACCHVLAAAVTIHVLLRGARLWSCRQDCWGSTWPGVRSQSPPSTEGRWGACPERRCRGTSILVEMVVWALGQPQGVPQLCLPTRLASHLGAGTLPTRPQVSGTWLPPGQLPGRWPGCDLWSSPPPWGHWASLPGSLHHRLAMH